MSGALWLGLDYPGVEVVMRRRRMTRTPRAFELLQSMEFAALDILRKPKGKADE